MRRYRNEADCNWCIGTFDERIFSCKNFKGYGFSLPFDPHNTGDYVCSEEFSDILESIRKDTPDGIRIERISGNDYYITEGDKEACEYFLPL